MRGLILAAALVLGACTGPELAERRVDPDVVFPPMKTFGPHRVAAPLRSNAEIAEDFLDLTFQLESGRELPVFTRFEGPITLRVTGRAPASLGPDLARLLERLRREAGLQVRQVPAESPAAITVEVVTRSDLRRAVPQAACFVAPEVSSWDEFLRDRRSSRLDWTQLKTRKRLAIFLPGDVAPQEIRDCLHEEVAQALGPLNDLYRLSDSVFNDDNFHTILTGFDMLILRATYAKELRSGMSRSEVARRIPGILNRLNPRGRGIGHASRPATTRDWIEAIETALGPRTSPRRRQTAAREAVRIARASGWSDNRLAFSLYAFGRLSLGADPELALASFLQAGHIYSGSATTQLQEAHVSMQLAAFALSAGQGDVALRLVDASVDAVTEGENAALLASLLMVKAEALELLDRSEEAQAARQDSLGWALYGFGDAAEVLARARDISALRPPRPEGDPA